LSRRRGSGNHRLILVLSKAEKNPMPYIACCVGGDVDGFLLIRRRAIHTPDAIMADAMMPKIPKIHGRRPAD
jgi:hypothetical protein